MAMLDFIVFLGILLWAEQWSYCKYYSITVGSTYATSDISNITRGTICQYWYLGSFLLNNSAHAGDSRKNTHNKMARELTKISNECGISTTCNESKLQHRDAGWPNQTRKRADMMTLQGGSVQPNHHLNFSRSTLLIMDVTISHVYNVHHSYKSGNLRQMEGSERQKYL